MAKFEWKITHGKICASKCGLWKNKNHENGPKFATKLQKITSIKLYHLGEAGGMVGTMAILCHTTSMVAQVTSNYIIAGNGRVLKTYMLVVWSY